MIDAQRRFLGLDTVGNQATEQMNHEIGRAAMAGMFDLADVLELVVDGLDDCSFAREQLVGVIHQHVCHLLAKSRFPQLLIAS